MRAILVLALGLFMGNAHAYDGLTSELSHATGGALLAGAVTRLYSESENRAWIGFAVSTTAMALESGYQISHGAKRSSQLLDLASHTAGAALGASVTDKYFLVPVVTRSYVGLVYFRQF